MLQLCSVPATFDYKDYSLDAIASNGQEEPTQIPALPKKTPIKLVSLVKGVESQLWELLKNSARDEDMEVETNKEERAQHVCTECGKRYFHNTQFQKGNWIRHALLHIAVDQFECHKCDFRCKDEADIKSHLFEEHSYSDRKLPPQVVRLEFTKTEMKLIDKEARKCFPEWGDLAPKVTDFSFLKRAASKPSTQGKLLPMEFCQLCKEGICGTKSQVYRMKEEHAAAAHHPTFKLWKCNQCDFGSTAETTVEAHFKKEHSSIKYHQGIHVKPAGHPERRKLYTEVLLKCFPDTTILHILK